jgi:tetratricopeptide (TPR) repeat protein
LLGAGLVLLLGAAGGVTFFATREASPVGAPGVEAAAEGLARDQILTAFREGRYAEITDAVEQAAALDPSDAPTAFAVAESYRLTGRLDEAGPFYRVVIDAPQAGRLEDDAVFWRAEALYLNGELTEASALYERVVGLPRSNFVKSAKRRLETLRAGQ